MNDMNFNSNLEEDLEGALNTGMPETEIMRADEVVSEVFDPVADETINIIPAQEIEDPEESLELVLGDKRVLGFEVKPWIANAPVMVWETSDPEIIYINPTALEEGTIEAIGVGEATVTATNPLDNSQKKVWTITVIATAPEKEEDENGENKEPEEGDNNDDPENTSLVDTTSLIYND